MSQTPKVPPPPKTPPPPTRPPTKPPRKSSADERIFAEAELLRADLTSPARPASGGGVGGPVSVPTGTTGRTSGLVAASPLAADGSGGGADITSAADAGFLSPRPASLRFPLDRMRAQGLRRLLDRNPLPPGR